MDRRDLLKRTGALAMGFPALRAISLTGPTPQSSVKDLIVTFSGPFCYWQVKDGITVMAPPVGTDYPIAPHQAWIATSANEAQLQSASSETPPDYKLALKSGTATPASPVGTPIFTYPQEYNLGASPLFSLTMPSASQMIGVRPTRVQIIEKSNSTKRQEYATYSAGLTFLYKDVDLGSVELQLAGAKDKGTNPTTCVFKPCFHNDNHLPVSFLAVHLTMLDQRPDEHHQHAKFVWSQMLTMYPWMLEEIKGINFGGFGDSGCNQQPCTKVKAPDGVEIGPGNDCEVPIMLLTGGGAKRGPTHT